MRSPRSVLYVPASKPSMLKKMSGLNADTLILDLEDGVAPDGKEQAGRNLQEAAGSSDLPLSRTWMVRINPPGTAWHDADLDLVRKLGPPMVILPKAEDPESVELLAERFAHHGSDTGLMIETVHGVGNVRHLAGAHPQVRMLILGSADYMLSVGARPDPGREWESHAMHALLLAARMHGCMAIDSVYFHFRDDEGLKAHAGIARKLGYDGKSCIHPAQVPVIHEVFSASDEEVSWAESVVQAWEKQNGATRGVIVLEGEMIEALHVTVARRILERRV